jgi:polysaccharide export outer membrane protein
MKRTFLFLPIITALFLNSCITNEKLNYLQSPDELGDTSTYKAEAANAYILRPGDELYIKVKPLYQEGGGAFQNSSTSSSFNMTSSSAYYYTYPIYEDGNIDYPYVGKINMSGLNMEEARIKIRKELEDYVQGMTVIVKLSSNYVNILGEVKSPGRKEITTEKLNLFEAIALAGDLAPYGNRAEVKIVRETKDGPVIKSFDLRRSDIINSEYYWIQPGDIIYVSRIKGQFFKMDSFSEIILIFSSSLSLVLLALSLN